MTASGMRPTTRWSRPERSSPPPKDKRRAARRTEVREGQNVEVYWYLDRGLGGPRGMQGEPDPRRGRGALRKAGRAAGCDLYAENNRGRDQRADREPRRVHLAQRVRG